MATSFSDERRWSQISGIEENPAGKPGPNSLAVTYRTDHTSSNIKPSFGNIENVNPISSQYGSNIIFNSLPKDDHYPSEYKRSEENETFKCLDELEYVPQFKPRSWPVGNDRSIVSQQSSNRSHLNKSTDDTVTISSNFPHDLFHPAAYPVPKMSSLGRYMPHSYGDGTQQPNIIAIGSAMINVRQWPLTTPTNLEQPSYIPYYREVEFDQAKNGSTTSSGLQAFNDISKLAKRIKAVGEILDKYDKVGLPREDETRYLPDESDFYNLRTSVSDKNAYDGYYRQPLNVERNNVWNSTWKPPPQSTMETQRNTHMKTFLKNDDTRKSQSVFDLRITPDEEYPEVKPYFKIPGSVKFLRSEANYNTEQSRSYASLERLGTDPSRNAKITDSRLSGNHFVAVKPVVDHKRSWTSEENVATATELNQDRIEAISTKFNYLPRAYRYILRDTNITPLERSPADGAFFKELVEENDVKPTSDSVWFPRNLKAKLNELKTSSVNTKHVSWCDDKQGSVLSCRDSGLSSRDSGLSSRDSELSFRDSGLSSRLNDLQPKSHGVSMKDSAPIESPLARIQRLISTDYSISRSPSIRKDPPGMVRGNLSRSADDPFHSSKRILQSENSYRSPSLHSVSSQGNLTTSQNLISNSSEKLATASPVRRSSVPSIDNHFGKARDDTSLYGPSISQRSSLVSSSIDISSSNTQSPLLGPKTSDLHEGDTYSVGSLTSKTNLGSRNVYSAKDPYEVTALQNDSNLTTRSQKENQEYSCKTLSRSSYLATSSKEIRENSMDNLGSRRDPLLSQSDSKQSENFRSPDRYHSNDFKPRTVNIIPQSTTTVNTSNGQQAVTMIHTSKNVDDFLLHKSNHVVKEPVEVVSNSKLYNSGTLQNPSTKESYLMTPAPTVSDQKPTYKTSTSHYVDRTDSCTGNKINNDRLFTARDSSERSNFIEKLQNRLSLDQTISTTQTKSLNGSVASLNLSTYDLSATSSSTMPTAPKVSVDVRSSVPTFSTTRYPSNLPVRNSSLFSDVPTCLNLSSAPKFMNTLKSSAPLFSSTSTTKPWHISAPTFLKPNLTSASKSTGPTPSVQMSSTYLKTSLIYSTSTSSAPTSSSVLTSGLLSSSYASWSSFSPPSRSGLSTFSGINTPTTQAYTTITTKSNIPTFNDIYAVKASQTSTISTTTNTTNTLTSSLPTFHRSVTTSVSSPPSFNGVYSPSSTVCTTTTTYSSATFDSMSINQNLLSSIEALKKLSNSLSNRRTQETGTKMGENMPCISQPVAPDDKMSVVPELGHFKLTSSIDNHLGIQTDPVLTSTSNQFDHSKYITKNFLTQSLTSSEKTGLSEGYGIDRSSLLHSTANQYDRFVPNNKQYSTANCNLHPFNNIKQISDVNPKNTSQFSSTSDSYLRHISTTVVSSTTCTSNTCQSGPMISSYNSNYLSSSGYNNTTRKQISSPTVLRDIIITDLLSSKTKAMTSLAGVSTSIANSFSFDNPALQAPTSSPWLLQKSGNTSEDLTLFPERTSKSQAAAVTVGISPLANFVNSSSVYSTRTPDLLPKYTYRPTSVLSNNEYDSYDSCYQDPYSFDYILPPVVYNRHRSISSTDSEDRCLSIGDSATLADDWTTATHFTRASPSLLAQRDCVDDGTSRIPTLNSLSCGPGK